VHRADLHGILLDAVRALGRVDVRPGQRVQALRPLPEGVEAETPEGSAGRARVLLGCDGLWSRVRALVLDDGAPVFSGHLAYRGLVRMDDVPLRQRLNRVSAWLGPRLHAVHYPVRGGQWMNVVVVVHGPLPADVPGWDHGADGTGLRQALGPVAADLDAVLQAVPLWRLWPLHARWPMRGPQEQAQGRVALLGDAAHPMHPYLAQGAAMALEDAWTLGRLLGASSRTQDGPELLSTFAQARWRRNAWVQARSRRNGTIFHARGPLRWGRNLAMSLLGERLLDVPRLYAGPVWNG
jgi:salicylate hydroxylase